MTSIVADIIWPALFLESRILSIWVIASGLLVEYFFVWRFTDLGLVKSIWADLAMNTASTLLGIILIPALGFIVALFSDEMVGLFGPLMWGFTFILAVALNTWIESSVLWLLFRQELCKRLVCWLFLANALSVGIAFASFAIYPITG